MLRKLIIGSSLLLASGSYASVHNNQGLEDSEIIDDLDLDDDTDLDLADHDLEWHVQINQDNRLGKATFHLGDKRELIALIDLQGLDEKNFKIEDTGLGYLTVSLPKLEDDGGAQTVQVLMQTLNVPSDQILAEVAGGKLAITVPENASPRTVAVHYRDSIEDLSFFKDKAEDKTEEDLVGKEDL